MISYVMRQIESFLESESVRNKTGTMSMVALFKLGQDDILERILLIRDMERTTAILKKAKGKIIFFII